MSRPRQNRGILTHRRDPSAERTPMRLRSVAVVACVASAVLLTRASSPPSAEVRDFVRLPGQVDVLYAAPYDANYSYGPKGTQLNALRAQATAAVTSTWQVTYDANFNGNQAAKDAFQAAVD